VSQAAPVPSTSWRARLALEVLDDDGRARLGKRSHEGPLRIQRPFYPEGDSPLHLYLLHPPGGLVGGDELDIDVTLRRAARALITTPAAQKLYRSSGPASGQRVRLQLERDARLEWLPAETIVFDAAQSVQRTRIELHETAACIAWDIGCFGRPASGLGFSRGSLRQEFEIWRGPAPLVIERSAVAGGSQLLEQAFGYAGLPVYGNLYAVPGPEVSAPSLVSLLRAELAPSSLVRFAATTLGPVVVLRALGTSVELVRQLFVQAWQHLRPQVIGREPHLPRIWAT
jgi:urease accessory protein